MLHETADAFLSTLASRRLLGFDLGSKTIGLAISDSLGMIATPIETIQRTKFSKDILHIQTLISKEAVTGLVIGLPLNMDGSEGPRCQSTRAFAKNLSEHISLPMLLWDERLSTAAVERMMIEGDLSRARRAELVDKLAAAYILQGFLDYAHKME